MTMVGRSGARRGASRLDGARVAVWGIGAEGQAATELARRHGATVTVVDDRAGEIAGQAADRGSRHQPSVGPVADVLAPAVLADSRFDVVVRSPGVSRYRPELQAAAAAGAVVTTLTGLWLEDFADAPVIAVTGSKGKTTTAVLAAAALRATGRRVALAGNMGRPVAELYEQPSGEPPPDAYVLEVSSFQAADLTVSPRVGVLTLLAPDHLDWHGSYERYVADKCNLFAHRSDMVVAVNAADPAAWAATATLGGRVGYGAPGMAIAPAGTVTTPGVWVDGAPYLAADQLGASRLALRGAHNLVNLCGALSAVRALVGGLPAPAALLDQLDQLDPLDSRLHTVARGGGVEFVDDALASNPAGAVAALATFAGRPLCLVAGGADRGVALATLVDALRRHEPPAAVVVLGPMGARLAAELAAEPTATVRCQAATSVADAVERAVALVGSGGVVLFSPGAPTPPAEGTYADRSAAFAAAATAAAARLSMGAAPRC